jgi:membrane peptidoglycan carboxypeptidase
MRTSGHGRRTPPRTHLLRRLDGLRRLRSAPDAAGRRRVGGPRGHRVLALGIAAATVVTALAIATLTFAVPLVTSLAGTPPTPRTFPADTLISDSQGRLIADIHVPGTDRIPVPLSQVSLQFQRAIVAVEDRGFWSEGAVDPMRVASAAWTDLAHGSNQGASTIPMQLAKLLYLTDDRSLSYKVRELAYANDLMQRLSRTQILDDYVNDVPFGEGALGIQAAAEAYFGITAAQLDLAQSAMLAGLPQAPGADDPLVDPRAAYARELTVLDAMVRSGYITRAQETAAAAEKLTFSRGDIGSYNLYPAYTSRVVQEVQSKLHVDLATAGLRITATLDPTLQALAQRTVSAQISALAYKNVTDGALVSIDPGTGDVLAYVGSAGPGAPGADYDMAAVPRQMGSSFKLFTYPTALSERRISMVTPVLDGPLSIPLSDGQVYSPMDYDRRWHGVVPIEMALGNSLNIPAIRVEMLAGIANVVATARQMGVTTLTRPPSSYGPSMTLGTYPVPLWEMAQAATAFADAGTMHRAEFVKEVSDASGRVLYGGGGAGKPVLDPGVAFIMNQILSTDANRVMEFGPNSALTLPGHVVSAKTGTTDDFKDNVTVGWTPHLVTATWVGNTNDAAMRGTTGVTGAAPIWHAFMTAALQGVSDDWPGPPPDVVPGNADGAPYGSDAIQEDAAIGQPAWFLNGTDWTTGAAELTGQDVAAPGGTTDVHSSGSCRYWTYDGGNYWYCGSGMSNLPGDPGPQPGAPASPPPPPPAPPPPPGGPGGGAGGGGHKHH